MAVLKKGAIEIQQGGREREGRRERGREGRVGWSVVVVVEAQERKNNTETPGTKLHSTE